ncbi:MAG: glycogen synthase [Chloroflexi bacterium]|nr:glycogen synthase [Chloroflexota bacterium]
MSEFSADRKRIKCLFTAVEADPLVKVGGLGDVAFSLPNALRNLHPDEIGGHEIDVRLILPCYSTACHSVSESSRKTHFDVMTGLGVIPTTIFMTEIKNMPVYLISSDLIPQNTSVYTSDSYKDGLKFLFFSQAALQLAITPGWDMDVLHANDWHTAIIPYLLKGGKRTGIYPKKMKSILTIHNLPFMGAGTQTALRDLGIPFSNDRKLPAWARRLPLPMGLSASDRIVAVSPSYASEIQTPEYGNDLNDFLNSRSDRLSGIINGLDTELWDPSTDHELNVQFSTQTLPDRHHNKTVLQKELALEENSDIPLLAFIGRMDQQKGIDLIIDALRLLTKQSWQAVLLGTGNTVLEKQALQLQTDFPDKVRAIIKFDSHLSRRIYGGADILMMPSRYEPCGLAQMIAMRYGCVPLAHATGGLIDTITDYGQNIDATGFLFEDCTATELAKTIKQALNVYKIKPEWIKLQRNGMKKDFSWHQSALSYANLYINI